MDHHLEAASDGIPFDSVRLARSFEAVRRAGEPSGSPSSPPVLIPMPDVFGLGPAGRMLTQMEVTSALCEAGLKACENAEQAAGQAAETARLNAVADMKPVASEAFQPVPEWFLFETPSQRRARMIRKFGYAC